MTTATPPSTPSSRMMTILPTFELEELLMGKFLGRGGFNAVYEIQGFSLQQHQQQQQEESTENDENKDEQTKKNDTDDDENDDNDNNVQHQSRLFIAQHCTRQHSGEARYAVKRPRRHPHHLAPSDNEQQHDELLQQAIQDLVLETYFLRQVEHPHIIKLRGVSSDIADAATNITSQSLQSLSTNSDSCSYFLVLDRLYDTLHTRIRQEWKPRLAADYKQYRQVQRRQKLASTLKRPLQHFLQHHHGVQQSKVISDSDMDENGSMIGASFLRERLAVAIDLSAAVEYLHERKIWHRDLKPDNIGFDIRGHVKIFDFGLARHEPRKKATPRTIGIKKQNDNNNEPTFLATQMTGTLRYMCPQVGLGRPYNAKCDVWSFVHVLWEMLTCQKPYLEYNNIMNQNRSAFRKEVWIGSTRPPLVPPSSSFQRPEQRQRHNRGLKVNPHKLPSNLPKWTPLTKATVDILQGGWQANLSNRWTMSMVKTKLQEEVRRLKRVQQQQQQQAIASASKGGHALDEIPTEKSQHTLRTYNRRRSTFVFGLHHQHSSKNKKINGKRRSSAFFAGAAVSVSNESNVDDVDATTNTTNQSHGNRFITA